MNQVEADWTTKAGYRAVVLIVMRGGLKSHRCGYVGLPKNHPLHGVDYGSPADCLSQEMADQATLGKKSPILAITATVNGDTENSIRRSPDIVFDVHGGITFSDNDPKYPAPSEGLWWFGFDAAHSGDGYIDESLYSFHGRHEHDHVVRSKEYMMNECELLAQQIADACEPK